MLDASAVIAFLDEEPGHDLVDAVAHQSLMSAVNFAEVVSKFVRGGMPAGAAGAAVTMTGIRIVGLDQDDALAIGAIHRATAGAGLSLGDRACLVLARRMGLAAMTADRAWERIAATVGVEVLNIRPAS